MNQVKTPRPSRALSTRPGSAADVAHVLIVDDDVELCELLSLRVEAAGYRVSVEHDVKGALARLGREHVDAVILDLRLGDDDGFDVLEGIQKRSYDVPVIVLTAHGTIETAVDATREGAFGFVTKPFHDHDLLQKVAHAIDSGRLRREVAGLRRIVGGASEEARLVGVSPPIEALRETIRRVATSDATVLVLGESGTGKELVARAVHAFSPRARSSFVAVNCAALAPELLESTLFGHTRGAFTGAVSDREGVFAAARGGTLFLDEIGETPLAVQSKLLRVLQEKTYTRLGSTVEESTDVRLVAATNRDLRQEVVERRFREDLFYRLHVIPISVPPLRDRPEDIMLLAEMFLERSAARHGVRPARISARAAAALDAHAWPGNVRELANVMEAAVLFSASSKSGEIEVEHLPGIGLPSTAASTSEIDALTAATERLLAGIAPAAMPPLRDARDAFERGYLDAVLKRTSGNVALAAKLAGRNRTDFYDLLRRHGRSPSDKRST